MLGANVKLTTSTREWDITVSCSGPQQQLKSLSSHGKEKGGEAQRTRANIIGIWHDLTPARDGDKLYGEAKVY